MNTAAIRHSSPSHSRNSSPRRQVPSVVVPNKTTNKKTRNKGDKKSKSVTTSEEVQLKNHPRNNKQDTTSALPYGSVKIIQRSTNLAVLKEDVNHRDTSKRRNNPPSAKSRRNQTRRDIAADVTDALEAEFTTPPQVTDSDDSSSTGDVPKQNKKNHKSTAHRQPNNSPTKSKPASRPSRPRRRSGSILEISEKHSSTTKATAPLSRTPPNDFMFGQLAINPLYAGPTFSNSPAPSALPMPGVRPTRSHDDNLFMMEDDTDTNASILRQKSLDLLDMIGVDRPRSQPVHPTFEAHMPVPYNVTYHQPHPIYHQQLPFVMATSHKPDLSLSEIQHNLRTMLKIQDGM